jgi:hypothetical protein
MPGKSDSTRKIAPLTEGYVVKGGRNIGSRIKERPAPPPALKTAPAGSSKKSPQNQPSARKST